MAQSVKALATQAQWLEFHPQNPHKKPDAAEGSCVPSPGTVQGQENWLQGWEPATLE